MFVFDLFGDKGNKKNLSEAANPAQQAAIAINMKKAHKKPKHLDEFAPSNRDDDEGGRPKFLPWDEFIGDLKAMLDDHFSVTENVVKDTVKARFVPHDPMEFGPTMLYSYYERRAGRNKGAISTRGAIQVGKYTEGGITGQAKGKLLTTFSLLKGTPFERHFDLTGENVQKIADIIIGNTQGALQFKPEAVAEGNSNILPGKSKVAGATPTPAPNPRLKDIITSHMDEVRDFMKYGSLDPTGDLFYNAYEHFANEIPEPVRQDPRRLERRLTNMLAPYLKFYGSTSMNEQGVAEAFANPGSGSTGTSRGAKRIANTVRKALAKNAETPEQRAARKDFEARTDAKMAAKKGVAESEQSDLRKLQQQWWVALPAIMKKAGLDYRPVKELSRDYYPTLGWITIPGEQFTTFNVNANPKGDTAKINISVDVDTSNEFYRTAQPERAAKLNAVAEKIAQALGGTAAEHMTGQRRNHPGVSRITATMTLPKEPAGWQNPSRSYDPRARFLNTPGERARQGRAARSGFPDSYGGDASNYRLEGVAEGAAVFDPMKGIHALFALERQYKSGNIGTYDELMKKLGDHVQWTNVVGHNLKQQVPGFTVNDFWTLDNIVRDLSDGYGLPEWFRIINDGGWEDLIEKYKQYMTQRHGQTMNEQGVAEDLAESKQMNEVNPTNYDSDVDYYAAVRGQGKRRGPQEPEDAVEPAARYTDKDAEADLSLSRQKKAATNRPVVNYSKENEGTAPNGQRYNAVMTINAADTMAADHEVRSFNDHNWGAKKIVDTVKDGANYTVYIVDNHKYGMWKPWNEQTTELDEGRKGFDTQLVQILRKDGYKGPVRLGQLKAWDQELSDILDSDDMVMIAGNDPTFDSYVAFETLTGRYISGGEGGYYIPTLKQLIKTHTMREGKTLDKITDREHSLKRDRFRSLQKDNLREDDVDYTIGDDVIITGPVQYKGTTGIVDSFGTDKKFVVVDLYNYGKHSFHTSDVSFNDYADSNEERDDWDEMSMRESGYDFK